MSDLKIRKQRQRKTENSELKANAVYSLTDDSGEEYRLHLSALDMGGDTYILGRHDESGMPAFWTLKSILDSLADPRSIDDPVLEMITRFAEQNDVISKEVLEEVKEERAQRANNAPSVETQQIADRLLSHLEQYGDLAIRTDDAVDTLGSLIETLNSKIAVEA